MDGQTRAVMESGRSVQRLLELAEMAASLVAEDLRHHLAGKPTSLALASSRLENGLRWLWEARRKQEAQQAAEALLRTAKGAEPEAQRAAILAAFKAL